MSERTKLFSENRSKALWLMALTLAVALIFASSAMTQTKQASAPAQKKVAAGAIIPVTITPGVKPDDPPKVLPASVEVGPNDEVEWTCSTGCDFDVTFTYSMKPFKDRSFNKNKKQSGKPTGAPGTYKYTVIVGGGVLDPDVIIKGSR